MRTLNHGGVGEQNQRYRRELPYQHLEFVNVLMWDRGWQKADPPHRHWLAWWNWITSISPHWYNPLRKWWEYLLFVEFGDFDYVVFRLSPNDFVTVQYAPWLNGDPFLIAFPLDHVIQLHLFADLSLFFGGLIESINAWVGLIQLVISLRVSGLVEQRYLKLPQCDPPRGIGRCFLNYGFELALIDDSPTPHRHLRLSLHPQFLVLSLHR